MPLPLALIFYLSSFCFCGTTFAIDQPAQHSIYNPHPSDLRSHRSTRLLSPSIPVITPTNIQSTNNRINRTEVLTTICQSELYGQDLNKDSCRNALQLLPRDALRRTYGGRDTRNVERFDIILPRRYLSRKLSWLHSLPITFFQSLTDGRMLTDISQRTVCVLSIYPLGGGENLFRTLRQMSRSIMLRKHFSGNALWKKHPRLGVVWVA